MKRMNNFIGRMVVFKLASSSLIALLILHKIEHVKYLQEINEERARKRDR